MGGGVGGGSRKVEGFGFSGFGFGVWVLGFGVWGLRSGVRDLGFWVSGLGFVDPGIQVKAGRTCIGQGRRFQGKGIGIGGSGVSMRGRDNPLQCLRPLHLLKSCRVRGKSCVNRNLEISSWVPGSGFQVSRIRVWGGLGVSGSGEIAATCDGSLSLSLPLPLFFFLCLV